MTNKELAVQIWCTIVQSEATVAASPNFKGTIKLPTNESAINDISTLTDMLSQLKDN